MRRARIAIAGALLALGLSGSASGRAAKTVDVDDDFFTPSGLTIKEGTLVHFNWVGDDEHNVYKEVGPGKYFDSGSHEGQGVFFSHRFKKAGNYRLSCILHEDMEMDLKVKKKQRN